jgi:hypothetical protein
MSLNILKRLDVSARTAHVLLREQLVYGLGFAEIDADNSDGDLTTRVLATGTDGVCSTETPYLFTSDSATFTGSLIGKYLVLSDTHSLNAGIHKIVAVPSTTTLLVQSGIYGTPFITDASISYRIINPTTNTGDTTFTIQGGIGTAPIWQLRLFINSNDTPDKVIRMELGPNGGFDGSPRNDPVISIAGPAPTMTLTVTNPTFSPTDVGRYLKISGADVANNGIFKIVGYTSSTVVTYTNASGTAYGACTVDINGEWTGTVLTDHAIFADPAFNRWYFKLEQSNLIAWTENAASNGVYQLAYAGAGLTRRPEFDSDFGVLATGTITNFLSGLSVIGATSGNKVAYEAVTYGIGSTYASPLPSNLFAGLPISEFDYRYDSTDIPLGCNVSGDKDDDRGTLYGMQWVSDQISYKSFVDNGRRLLSLGGCVAIEWDGSLAR